MTSKLLACDQLEMLNASKCVMPTWLVKWISWGLTPQQMDVRYYTCYWQLATIMIPLLRVNNDKQLKPLNVDEGCRSWTRRKTRSTGHRRFKEIGQSYPVAFDHGSEYVSEYPQIQQAYFMRWVSHV